MVSVIIPTYNRAEFVCRAIRSVLAQTFRDFEILIIDDASRDNTEALIRTNFSHEIEIGILRYIKNETNLERSRSRNKGVALSIGEYIAFLDDDDIWLPDHLAQLIDFFNKNDNIGCVFSNFFIIFKSAQKTAQVRFIDNKLKASNNMQELCILGELAWPTSAVIKKEVFILVGGFNDSLSYLEDKEFFCRVAMNYGIGYASEPTACSYQHDGSHSEPSPEKKEYVWEIIEQNAKKYNFYLRNELVAESYLNICWSFIPNTVKAKEYFYKAVRLNMKVLLNIHNIQSFIGLFIRGLVSSSVK